LVHLESELLLLQDVMKDRLYPNALTSAKNVLRDDPGNRFALNAAADASVGLRDFDACKRYGRELLTRYPEFVPGVVTQGRVAVALGDYRSAESFFRAGLEKNPGEPVLVYSLALTLIAEKRSGEAQPLIVKALEVPGTDPSFRVLLSLCRAIAGDAAQAKSELSQAIANGYKDEQTLRQEPLLAPLRKIAGFDGCLAPLTAPRAETAGKAETPKKGS
jgi:predicted Zn-dependent protease